MENTSLEIVKLLKSKGHSAYWAGGCVRDMLLGTQPKDYDIVTSAKPDEIEKLLEHTIPIGKEFGVILAVKNGHHFEIATFRSDSGYSDGRRPDAITFTHAEDDAKRRDFTINGLFFDPIEKKLHDFVDGKRDIADKIIKFIGDPHERILEDHLRIIRAIRFKSTLDFQYHPDTYKAIKHHSHLSAKVSGERLRDELNKMIAGDNPIRAFSDMEDTGVLQHVIPELVELKGVAQPLEFHHEGDVWDHTMQCLKSLQPHHTLRERWAVLFHDIAKPKTFAQKERIRYDKHPEESAKMATKILDRLKFPRAFIKEVAWAIEHHFNMKQIIEMEKGRQRKWFLHKEFPTLMTVFKADIAGTTPSDYTMFNTLSEIYELAKKELGDGPKKLITGEEVMEILGMSPGAKVGEILDEIHERQLAGEIKTKKDAIRWVSGRE
ncbi:MAG: tRNA nucleotidyltransferase/poly(A) polymerase, poly(A) polymerase [Candidatus Peregrinibacteria bacterium GW2011_GWF2_43_17]|nr:MAG: tRNA nucleotidyltransferase/poly(A) polymerase, poly(A) polymerase [Candidatus Peregrinibacteria bacterium GW2011_GWF2_43_17]KKT20561.1 MAG: metal dependent phosphohydrolase [Candidatus Peregrinibacteria bacterium GW2011_GWA2_43_8]HAU39921.1 phosphohydrolase [Candidatus Peregrinibacteria bacterium]